MTNSQRAIVNRMMRVIVMTLLGAGVLGRSSLTRAQTPTAGLSQAAPRGILMIRTLSL